MAEVLKIITSYVTPGGVAMLPVQGGHVTCRVTLGHMPAEDGLLSELADGADRLPWSSKKAKVEAMDSIRARASLDDATRAKLLTHLAAASFFEPGVDVE